MSWFLITQNNSGGSFRTTDKLCHRLYIEADNTDDAKAIAEDLGCYWNGCEAGIDCECCGDRWHEPWDEIEFPVKYGDYVFDTIEDYAQHLYSTFMRWTQPDGRIFYSNGEVKEIG